MTRAASDIDKYVGGQIRARRVEQKVSQEKLGEHLGVSFQQIQKYERGTNRVSAGKLYLLAQVLSADMNYFFPREESDLRTPEVRSVIQEPGALEMALAFVGIKSRNERTSLLDLARAMGGAS